MCVCVCVNVYVYVYVCMCVCGCVCVCIYISSRRSARSKMRTSIHDLVITEEEGTGLARLLSESDQKK